MKGNTRNGSCAPDLSSETQERTTEAVDSKTPTTALISTDGASQFGSGSFSYSSDFGQT